MTATETTSTLRVLSALAYRMTDELDPHLPLDLDGVDLDDLIALRLAVKGDPRRPGSGLSAVVGMLAREIDNALYDRMEHRKEHHGRWELERYRGGDWRMDGSRVLSAVVQQALLQADAEASPEAVDAIVKVIGEVVSVDTNVRVSKLRELFDDKEVPEKYGTREQGSKSVTLRAVSQ